MTLDAKIPSGPIADKWDRHKFEMKLVNPANTVLLCEGRHVALGRKAVPPLDGLSQLRAVVVVVGVPWAVVDLPAISSC